MKTKTVWIVWGNTDTTEGRGREIPLYVCETRATAERFRAGMGVMGSDAPVEPFESVEKDGRWLAPFNLIIATREDASRQAELDAKAKAVERALKAGLTKEEIEALQL